MLTNSESGRLVAKYGYRAVLLGTVPAGEAVVIVAGFPVHRGICPSRAWRSVPLSAAASTTRVCSSFPACAGSTFCAVFPRPRPRLLPYPPPYAHGRSGSRPLLFLPLYLRHPQHCPHIPRTEPHSHLALSLSQRPGRDTLGHTLQPGRLGLRPHAFTPDQQPGPLRVAAGRAAVGGRPRAFYS